MAILSALSFAVEPTATATSTCTLTRAAATLRILIGGLIVTLPVQTDCTLSPAPTKVPDASTATQEQMLAAMQTLKRYSTDVANYLICLEFETSQGRLSPTAQAEQHNVAVIR